MKNAPDNTRPCASPILPKMISPPVIPPIDVPAPSPHWRVLARLPDPMGYGGMFAGVLGQRLVTGGGSQFRDQPVWLGGQKSYSDRIFTLSTLGQKWQEHETRLPEECGHFASAATAEVIYLVGGLSAGGALRSCFELRARGDDLEFSRLPDFPSSLCYGSAAIACGRLIVVGGQRSHTERAATTETWSLELGSSLAWRREPDFPGPGVFVATAASDGEGIFVFGGMAFDSAGRYQPSNQAGRFNVCAREWEPVPSLPEPRVGAATPGPLLGGGKILLIGGYAEVFGGPPREHPGFSSQTLVYDIAQRTWSRGPVMPKPTIGNRDYPSDEGPGPIIAAPCTLWENHAVVIGGESRAGARTPAVIAWPIAAQTKPEITP